jgi:hypothetical protein
MAASIASVEAVGQPSLGVSLFLAGIASAEAFGNPAVYIGGMGQVIAGSAWKKAIEAKVLIGGIWRDIDKPYAIIGGEWVELS